MNLKMQSAAFTKLCAFLALSLVMIGCAGLKVEKEALIRLNQVGFYSTGDKRAVVPAVEAGTFQIVNDATHNVVYSAQLSDPRRWPPSKEKVKMADFSDLTTPGRYRLIVDDVTYSNPFVISTDPFRELNKAAIKAFYFNRASTALPSIHAGQWTRAGGHFDTQALIHLSAVDEDRAEGDTISVSKGWYDAGDYNKYVVNSGISTYTMLAAYEHFQTYYDSLEDLNIPESDDGVPDIINEILWNLEWLLSMQAPDGGVYHKLTSARFADRQMPSTDAAKRYIVKKSTAATLNFSAVTAIASRIIRDNFSDKYPDLASKLESASLAAWQWAKANPKVAYRQRKLRTSRMSPKIRTGTYAARGYKEEFAWAAAELYITTGKDTFYRDFDRYDHLPYTPSWTNTMYLAWMSLAHHLNRLSPVANQQIIRRTIIDTANNLLSRLKSSAYGIVMGANRGSFIWGSNSIALNESMMLIQATKLTGDRRYIDAALTNLDYVLGRNATHYSMVTGFGSRTPKFPHHRISDADGVADPVPGLIVGGPHKRNSDHCVYPARTPAKSYLDDWCSYSTNEVAINWNAPLVYVTGALESLF